MIVWESYIQFGQPPTQDGDRTGLFGQLFASSGARVGNEFQVNFYTTGSQKEASITMDGAGRFVVAWTGVQYDGDDDEVDERIFAQAFDSAANRLGTEFQVNAYTGAFADSPTVAVHPDGEFLVAWQTSDDGDDEGLAARRFTLGAGGAFTIDKRDQGVGWNPDGLISHTITVTAPPEAVDDVVINETVPRRTRFDAAASTAGWQCTPGGDLAANIERERARIGLDQWVGITTGQALQNLQLLTCDGFEQILLCAELNGDCVVTTTDALIILRMAVHIQPARAEADVDGNGVTAATDALRALRIAVGLDPVTTDCNPA